MNIIGVTCNQRQIRPRGLIWLGPALLPVPKRTEGNAVAGSKFLLCEVEGAADYFRLGRRLHPLEVCFGERLRIRIGASSLLDGVAGSSGRGGLGVLPEVLVFFFMLVLLPRAEMIRMRSARSV